MKIRVALCCLALFSTLVHPRSTAHAQSTAFTYQGRLDDGVGPATGLYDLRFALYDLDSGGSQQGPLQTKAFTDVTNGLFMVKLDLGNQFPGADRWLEIQVRTNGGSVFTVLAPRQLVTATPYAITSINAGTAATVSGNIPVGQLTGTIPLAQLPASVVTNGASGVNITGTFNGNGVGVSNLNLTLNSGGAIRLGTGEFILNSTPSVGNTAYSVTAADVNGDGKQDLISANYNGNTLSVLTNNGSGRFALASSPGVGLNPQAVTSADVNADGKIDLISANYNANSLSVLTNNGNGSFTLASTPGVGGNPRSVVAADVNGDGKADLISANFGFSTLTVLTNNGSGGFVFSSTLIADTGTFDVAAAGINGDGKVDLISANYSAFNMKVFTNTGSGSFVLSATLTQAVPAAAVAAADVNSDGKLDLISGNGGTTLSVYTNAGGGGFAFSSSPSVGLGPFSVTAADVNGDGKVDLISAGSFTNNLTVLLNNGSGGFVQSATPSGGVAPQFVMSADVNGDGKPDLISANGVANTLAVWFNAAGFNGVFVGAGQFSTASVSDNISFGATLGPKLNLYSTTFGLGIQNSVLYSRVGAGGGFGWFVGGVHNDSTFNAGGGSVAMTLTTGGLTVNGTFVSASDRNLKQDFSAVNSRSVLEKVVQLPIQTWFYKNDPRTKHLGPMAQDFYAAFAVGPDDKHITTVDESGVALAAIQGLNQKLEAEMKSKDARIAELEQRLSAIETLLQK